MRSVNANLLAINQAKSRINQAKKEGKTSVGLNAPTTPEGGGDGTSGGGSTTTGGGENTGGQGSESSGGTGSEGSGTDQGGDVGF